MQQRIIMNGKHFKGTTRQFKKMFIIYREKNVLNKTYESCSSKHSLFLDFFCKTKKMICIENIGFLGVLWKIYLLQFYRQNKIDYCISFTKPWSRVSQAAFFKCLKNKIWKNIFIFFPNFHVFMQILYFLYWKQMENKKKYACSGVGHSIPYKMMFVSTIQIKNCGRRQISYRKSVTFQENGKTHQNTTILCVNYIT